MTVGYVDMSRKPHIWREGGRWRVRYRTEYSVVWTFPSACDLARLALTVGR